jgi:hypothetical protein
MIVKKALDFELDDSIRIDIRGIFKVFGLRVKDSNTIAVTLANKDKDIIMIKDFYINETAQILGER